MTSVTPPVRPDIRACEVCDRERQVYVSCCGFGAMSLAYCAECLGMDAEPEFGFQYLWDSVANRDRTALKPEIKQARTWKNDRYWTWDEWVDNELKHPRPMPEEQTYPDENSPPETDFKDLTDFGFDVKDAKSDDS